MLYGDALEAEAALTAQAQALARLHVATVDGRSKHAEVYRALLARNDAPEITWSIRADGAAVASVFADTWPATELAAIEARLAAPGPWMTLRHGDPCPDNILLIDGHARLVDYEFSRPGHALLDGLYWRLGFPNCWCAGQIPRDVADRVETAYRTLVATTIPAASDTPAFKRERAYVAAAWLINRLHLRLKRALTADERFRVGTLRGRVLYHLSAVAAMTEEAGVLPGINASALSLRARLAQEWPESADLALYPAFSSGNRHSDVR